MDTTHERAIDQLKGKDRKQPRRPQLILDVGGVLAANLTDFWTSAASAAGMSYNELRARYKQELRTSLWTGELSEAAFWEWLAEACPLLQTEQAQAALQNCLKPLPALALLPRWHRIADIHILSNHRAEWLRPWLSQYRSYLTSLTISSEAGCCKPDPALYRLAAVQLLPGRNTLYVDDAERNLLPAAALGWRTLLADPEGHWVNQVEDLLACST
ncbi:haloacid dehalogenase [Paenibacillus sambharensis]|uniref:Haloacid dehalogenase n=1 Tax=Paenibacillus sambharensis TaxID=1803190 RepID=A0A2W1LWE0_9BACL|nr:HAD-IA family hydrolase [Paenibacillus sambharensis]PZD95807.1 haloacid dehalogenase [Paenibacillus sambharensis]